MDTKSLSFGQVYWAQKLICYHFQIDYCQGKINGAANALLWYSQKSAEEEKIFEAENKKILHCLQFLLAKISSLAANQLSLLYQILICRTIFLSQLYQFWNSIQNKIGQASFYIAIIESIRLQLPRLQNNEEEAKTLRSGGLPEV